MSRSRSDTMPYGALVLERLLEHSKPKQVEMSVYGVREGLLYSKLPKRKRESDALLASCWDFARRYARSPEHELELCDWTDQIFGEGSSRKLRRSSVCAMPPAFLPISAGGRIPTIAPNARSA